MRAALYGLLLALGVVSTLLWLALADNTELSARVERLNADVRRHAERTYRAEERYDQDIGEYADAAALSLWRLQQCEKGRT